MQKPKPKTHTQEILSESLDAMFQSLKDSEISKTSIISSIRTILTMTSTADNKELHDYYYEQLLLALLGSTRPPSIL